MEVLIIIGAILMIYGGISLRFPKKKEQNMHRKKDDNQFFRLYQNLYIIGGWIALIAGILLVISGVIVYGLNR